MHNKSKINNWIIAIGLVLIAMLLLGIRYDYFYDLNDDVLIKDIISGAYLGKPVSRNIQMLYPLSLLFSALYTITPKVAWYGLFLCLCQFGSLLIIIVKTLELLDNDTESLSGVIIKIMTAVSELLVLSTLMLQHLIDVQYTITVAFMAAASIMWISTSDNKGTVKKFIVSNIFAIIIILLGFLLRSEMMLLMLPFIALSGAYKWSFEDKLLTKLNVYKYVSVFLIIIALMGAGLLINKAAYSSKGWDRFSDLFDARTQLYDYQVLPVYEENIEFYDSIGLSKEEVKLFENYNYGIDTSIDEDMMWKVAKYASQNKANEESFLNRIKTKLRIYIYEITHGKNSVGSDYPWNMVAGILYLLIAIMVLANKKLLGIVRLLVLFLGRSLIWMYILLGDRSPERITHSLYFVEIVVLLGLLVCELSHSGKNKNLQIVLFSVIMLLEAVWILPQNVFNLNVDVNLREETNEPFLDLYKYMSDNDGNFYFLDVYSTVAYSEKMFIKDVNKSNSELLGGWFMKSPASNQKVSKLGADNIEDALLNEGIYFVKSKDISMDWLTDYYSVKGIDIESSLIDSISGVFEIYDIKRQ